MKISWKTVAPLAVWLVIYLIPTPAGLNANQWHYFAVFAAVIAGLVLESMPVGAVGLIGLTVACVLGYVESDPNKSLRWALSGLRGRHGLADRRRVHLLDRLSQERAGQAHRAAAGPCARQEDAGPGLRDRLFRPRSRAGDAFEHRAQRRDDLSDREQHPEDLRLRTGADGGPDRHLRDVDRVRRHRGHQLDVPHRAGPERSRARDRQEDGRHRHHLVAVVHRLCPARNPADAAGAVAFLHDLPARDQGQPGNRHLGRERAEDDGAAVAQRMDHERPGSAGDVPVDHRLESDHQAARPRRQLHQCDDGRIRHHLPAARHRRHRLQRHRLREECVGSVLLLHFAADPRVGAERHRLRQMGRGGLRQAARPRCRRRSP